MVERKKKTSPPLQLSESQAGPFQFDYLDKKSTKLQELWGSLKDDDQKYSALKIAAGAMAAVAIIALITPSITTQNSNNTTIINNKHSNTTKNITINQMIGSQQIELRPWKELPLEEREIIKADTRAACPEIDTIGNGTSWDCATKYLTNRGIKANSTRDLFRK
jgi:hypothetical protein